MNDYDNIWGHRAKWAYLLLIVFVLMSPVFYVMYISFNLNGFGAASYVFTWKWYGMIFSDQLLMQALRWTMTLSVMTDMRYFVLILLILVVGNVRCLYGTPAAVARLTCDVALHRRLC